MRLPGDLDEDGGVTDPEQHARRVEENDADVDEVRLTFHDRPLAPDRLAQRHVLERSRRGHVVHPEDEQLRH